MSGDVNIPYSGKNFANDQAVVTADEVSSGEVAAPEGTETYVVQPGDTLYEIATNGGYGNPPDMEAFYRDNPQYAESERNPDLIWPGEVVFVRSSPQEQLTPGQSGATPTNGTVATGNVDANGNPEFQNYANGQPVGPPYTSPETGTGQPANADTIDAQGNVIRTGDDGRPLTGWAPTTPGANGSNGAETEYTYYVDGRATTETVTSADGAPDEPPAAREVDFAEQPIEGDGWYVVNGSSSGAQWAYFVDGHEVAGTRTTESKGVDDPAPVVGPKPPQNGTVATSAPNENGVAQFQNYQDGQPLGPPYYARMGANGQPANADTVDAGGNVVRTDAEGAPLTGWAPTTPGANGSDGSEVEYGYYENGVPTGVTRTTSQGLPSGVPTPSERTDAAAQASSSADTQLDNAAEDENPEIGVYEQQATEASDTFDAAALAEIEATKELPPNANREDHANAVLEAAERIAERLEAAGLQDQADRVRELARERADEINNEV